MDDRTDRDLVRAEPGEMDADGRSVVARPLDFGQPVVTHRVADQGDLTDERARFLGSEVAQDQDDSGRHPKVVAGLDLDDVDDL